jgi:hypothetical protein
LPLTLEKVRALTFIIAVNLAVGCNDPSAAPTRTEGNEPVTNRIPKSKLAEMFANIREETTWNLDGDMLWGYFFIDADRSALERAATKLEAEGYRYVDLFQPEDAGKPLPYFFLHVEKIETHNVDSLYDRNSQLEAFARRNGLDTYDGMDVGPVKPPGSRD